MKSHFKEPVNIGSEEMVSINRLAQIAIDASGKNLSVYNIDGDEFKNKYGFECPLGVNGRNSHNQLYREKVGWDVSQTLKDGMFDTYPWVYEQVKKSK